MSKVIEFQHSTEEIRKALAVERLGGVCLLNFCAGGETLLAQSVLPVVKALLEEGHYVMVVTNGTVSQSFEKIASWEEKLLEHLFIKFSFHYLEMKRLNMLDVFVSNVHKIAETQCSYTVEVTPSDELIPYIDELMNVCMEEFGALCHITIARDDRTGGIELLSGRSLEEFYDIWSVFDSGLLDYKYSIFKKKRTEFCYAGAWSYYLNLNTGDYQQCYTGNKLGNIYENPNEPLLECPVGTHCGLAHCYNGHAFLTLGDIPGVDTSSYADTRNRLEGTEKEWLKPKMKAIMNSRLYETNVEYTALEKSKIELEFYKNKCESFQSEYDDLEKRYKELEQWHTQLQKDYDGLAKGHKELEYWHEELKKQMHEREKQG